MDGTCYFFVNGKTLQTDSFERVIFAMEPEDVAAALSKICRFAGNTPKFYSVAQHCCLCANIALELGDADAAKWLLVHDAAEAVIGDIPYPVKMMFPDLWTIEDEIEKLVGRRFGLGEKTPLVKRVDRTVGAVECRVLFGLEGLPEDAPHIWFVPLTPEDARENWLKMYRDLFGRE